MMGPIQRKPIFWQLYPKVLAISLVILFSFFVFSYSQVRSFYYEQSKESLVQTAQLMINSLELKNPRADHSKKLSELVRGTNLEVLFVNKEGRAEAFTSSRDRFAAGDNVSDRLEIQTALGGKRRTHSRYDFDQKIEFLHVALPVYANEAKSEVSGVLRASLPMTDLEAALQRIFLDFLWATLALVVAAAIASWLLALRVASPIQDLRKKTKLLSQGVMSGAFEVDANASKELHSLGKAINKMANQLRRRIRTILEHRDEQEAVFSSMVEGVIAINEDGRIFHVNDAAIKMLETEMPKVMGKTIHEAIRIPEMQALMLENMTPGVTVENEIMLVGIEDRYFQVHGTLLARGKNGKMGKLFVFNDVSKIKRLENHRRDFVANVSHELRTPLTSIKGFVETLLAGAYQDPEESKKFLGIIQQQTERLSAIIHDLMRLSKIERETDQDDIHMEDARVRPVIESAIDICRLGATKKNIALSVECDRDLKGKIDPTLLEQAVINLIDNAIKYSEDESLVTISAKEVDGEVVISVLDQGGGIAQEHLPRIFERFYRVDKARSRKVGGTGLGLSIVKHIAIAHRGRATVESRIGEGSRFSIHVQQPGP